MESKLYIAVDRTAEANDDPIICVAYGRDKFDNAIKNYSDSTCTDLKDILVLHVVEENGGLGCCAGYMQETGENE